MKLKILGNNGPYPKAGGACSGYLVTNDAGTQHILLDCGTGSLQNLLSTVDIERLDAVILSHLHFDHMSDMLPMIYALQFHPRNKPLPVYAPQTPEAVHSLLEVPQFDIWEPKDFTLGDMRISFTPTRHPVETYAVRIDCDHSTLVYTGDSNTQMSLEFFCDGADLLLADAGLSNADYRFAAPHFSAVLCGKLAADAKVKKLLLTHLNPKYDPEQLLNEAREAFALSWIAEIGEEYYV